MRCPNCDRENRDVARFCQYCGASMAAAEPLDVLEQETLSPEIEPLAGLPQKPVAESPALSEENAPLASEATAESIVQPHLVERPDPMHPPIPAKEETDQELPDKRPAVASDEMPAKEALATEATAAELTLEEILPCDAGGIPYIAEEQMPTPQEAGSTIDEPYQEPPLNVGTADEDATVFPDQADVTGDQEPGLDGQGPESFLSEGWQDDAEQTLDPASLEPAELEPIPPEETPGEASSALTPEPQRATDPGEPLTELEDLVAAGLLPWSDRAEPTEAAFQALEPGAVVNGRYQVIEVMQAKEQEAWYRVRDLQQCPRCGFTGNSPGEAFCASCGALMEQKPAATMLERAAPQDDEPAETEAGEYFEDKNHHYWVWQEMKQEPIQEIQPAVRLILGQKSDTGQVRELDEDSLFALTMSSTYASVTRQLGLFVVADGMGGHEGGEVASRIAIQSLAQTLLRDVLAPELAGSPLSAETILDHLGSAVHAANDRVYLERKKRETDMGTTLTVALVVDWALYLAHVGDCRAYRWGQEGLQQLTTDHSIVAGMVAAGAIRPEEIYTHPQRSVIYRSIGDHPAVEVDLGAHSLSPDDRLVLCCDGLWEMIHSEGIEDVLLRESDPQTACDVMVEQANRAGGSDNISVIIIQFYQESR